MFHQIKCTTEMLSNTSESLKNQDLCRTKHATPSSSFVADLISISARPQPSHSSFQSTKQSHQSPLNTQNQHNGWINHKTEISDLLRQAALPRLRSSIDTNSPQAARGAYFDPCAAAAAPSLSPFPARASAPFEPPFHANMPPYFSGLSPFHAGMAASLGAVDPFHDDWAYW
jgi:hypothetical protein